MLSNLSNCSRHKEWFPGLTRRKWPLKEVISPHPSRIDWRNSSRFSMWLATQCSLKTRDSTRFGGESAGLPTSEQLLRAIPRLQRHRASADHVTKPRRPRKVRLGLVLSSLTIRGLALTRYCTNKYISVWLNSTAAINSVVKTRTSHLANDHEAIHIMIKATQLTTKWPTNRCWFKC